MTLKIENNNSGWNFWDLFDKTVNQITDLSKEIKKYSDPKCVFERSLIRFLERIPSGDYSNIRDEWNKRD